MSNCLFDLSLLTDAFVFPLFLSQAPKPGPYVKEMHDAGQFYTNRVLKDYKEK